VRLVMRCLKAVALIAAWTTGASICLGIYGAVCGAALGAAHRDFTLAASLGLRAFFAGAIAGAVVGASVAMDRVETEFFLANQPRPDRACPRVLGANGRRRRQLSGMPE
jgi:hypothetical protein